VGQFLPIEVGSCHALEQDTKFRQTTGVTPTVAVSAEFIVFCYIEIE